MLSFTARRKFDAYEAKKGKIPTITPNPPFLMDDDLSFLISHPYTGMSSEEAKEKYIAEVERQIATYGDK